MYSGMRKPRGLKISHYAYRLIDLNKYLALFPGGKLSERIGVVGINKILLNSMPNSWSKQSYVQVFDYDSITFNKSINMFFSHRN